jgi:hypothetical protein
MNQPNSPSYWKVITALVVIFCAGQGLGFLWAARLSEDAKSSPEKSWTHGWVDATAMQLKDQLNLSDAQITQIEPVLQETGNKIWSERRRALFQIHLNILDVHSSIDEHLSEDQRVKLEESHQKLKRRIQREFPEIMEVQ